MEESTRGDGFAKGKSTCSEDDDGPEEIVEIFFGEDTSSKKEHERDDGNDTHVSEYGFELMRCTPEADSCKGYEDDEPLTTVKSIFHGPNGNNCCVATWVEGNDEENPDEENGNDAHREGDEEPCSP